MPSHAGAHKQLLLAYVHWEVTGDVNNTDTVAPGLHKTSLREVTGDVNNIDTVEDIKRHH